MHRVRFDGYHGAYYGRLIVNKIGIGILPDDDKIMGLLINESRLIGVDETDSKTIRLNLLDRRHILIHLKSPREQAKVLAKIRRLISDESTSGSDTSDFLPCKEELKIKIENS